MSDPATPTRPYVRRDRSPAARNAAQRAEAEIAARERVSEHGKCKSVGFLVARRGRRRPTRSSPVQVNLLYQALRTSGGAMSDTNLAAVERVVRIVRELGLHRGFGGGARGTERRRKPLESLVSGAGTAPVGSPLAEEHRAGRRRRPARDPRLGVPRRPISTGGRERNRTPSKGLDRRPGTRASTPRTREAWRSRRRNDAANDPTWELQAEPNRKRRHNRLKRLKTDSEMARRARDQPEAAGRVSRRRLGRRPGPTPPSRKVRGLGVKIAQPAPPATASSRRGLDLHDPLAHVDLFADR